jgi:hypothetical protein
MLSTAKNVVVSALLALGLIYVFASSLDFQNCVYEYEKANPNAKYFEEGTPFFIRLIPIYRHCVGDYVSSKHDVITAVFTIVIAVFTTVLAIFTISLARSTRIAADAAKAAAEHIPTVEGAFIHVLLSGDLIGSRLDSVEKEQFFQGFPEIRISLKNFGKTPGFIELFNVRLSYFFTGDQNESDLISVPENTIIGSGDSFPPEGGLAVTIKQMTPIQAANAKNGTGTITLVGTLIYSDIWGSKWNVPFDGKYVAALASFRIDNQPHQKKT